MIQRCAVFFFSLAMIAAADDSPPGHALVDAARQGKIDRVKELLADGTDVNAPGRFSITAAWQAVAKGNDELLQLLLEAGADVNVADSVWHLSPFMLAADRDTIELMIRNGAEHVDRRLDDAARFGSTDVVRAILAAADLTPEILARARAQAQLGGRDDVVELLNAASPRPLPELPSIPAATLESYAGKYVTDRLSEVDVLVRNSQLAIRYEGSGTTQLVAVDTRTFAYGSRHYQFQVADGRVVALVRQEPFVTSRYTRRADSPADFAAASTQPVELTDEARVLARDRWPAFRGIEARGIATQQNLPEQWNVEKGEQVRWRTPVAGLGNSCPVVWDDRVLVTTAISESGNDDLRIGLYGSVEAVNDESKHSWRLLCLDRESGEVLWERIANEAIPPIKRHLKSTQANSTPATDGRHVVALFTDGGLYCYDFEGKLLWKRDLGVLDSGAFHDRDYEWGFGSSPIIYRDTVIVQCDLQSGSFIATYDLKTGEEIWREPRDEIPSWGTPTVYETPRGALLLTNGTNFARAYDVVSGRERWRLSGNAAVTVPTPFVAHNLIFVTSGYRPIQPIFAVRLDAAGDISLEGDNDTTAAIAWSKQRGGPYLPTPIAYQGYFYTCGNNGILTCYEATTGKLVYRKRAARGKAKSFTASPVAADGRLYLTSEAGTVLVVRAGPEYELLAENSLGEECLATPAIAGGLFIARTHKHVVALGK